MSTFVRSGITQLITSGGLSNGGTTEVVAERTDGQPFDAVTNGDEVYDFVQQAFSRSGSVVPPTGVTMHSDIEADADTSLEFIRFRDGNGQDYFRISGGGASNISNGTKVTVKTGSLDAINDGVAEILLNGISSVSFTAEILDGGGTVLSSQGISMSWTGGGTDHFAADSNVTFNNGTGNPWSVEELRVEVGAGLVLSDTSISTSVANNGSLKFTTIEQNVTNLSAGI